jgi:putative intracellular protease/amidase
MTPKFLIQIIFGVLALLVSANQAHAFKLPEPRGKVLVVLSAANSIPLVEGRAHPTGIFLGEIAEPVDAMIKAGYELVYASPNGAKPTIDQDSLRGIYWDSKEELARAKAVYTSVAAENFSKLASLEELAAHPEQLEQFDAMFVPGGHGPLVDLLYKNIFVSKELNTSMGRVLEYFHNAKKPTGLICHAPAALAAAPVVNGHWIYEGYKVTAISRITEFFNENVPGFKVIDGHVGLYPSDILREAGAKYVYRKTPFVPYVVEDRELMTGQDPFSAKLMAKRFVEKLDLYMSSKNR